MGVTTAGLWARIVERTAAARASGALVPLETDGAVVEDAGIAFSVRVARSLRLKPPREAPDPFDPPEPPLTLGPVGPTHLAVLNKFNVVDHHLLLVTRTFVDQEARLDLADLEALWACLDEGHGLGFYNGGRLAGASQRHKHLQLVPAPVGAAGGRTAIDGHWRSGRPLPYPHAWAPYPASPAAALELYHRLLASIGCAGGAPYNLLVTREYLLAVPRSQERARGVSINALGFAGSLFVKDAAGLEVVRAAGATRILREVCPARTVDCDSAPDSR
jgi:sulfate adenylyltransferase (ADP) / ATP adenylyltransferase